MKNKLLTLAIGVLSCTPFLHANAAVAFKEQLLGKADFSGSQYPGFFSSASESGCHLGWVVKAPKGLRVVVDGKTSPVYDDYDPWCSEFSKNGKHLAYVVQQGKKWCVVLDGLPGHPYDDILSASISFSPDGTRMAYVAQVKDKCLAVVDGLESKPYDQIGDAKAAFGLFDGRCDGQRVRFSLDSKHTAYAARVGERWCVVADGKAGELYDKVLADASVRDDYDAQFSGWQVCLSASGGHIAFAARTGTNWFVVVDGKVGPDYAEIADTSLSLGSNGTHVAYTAKKGSKWCAVVDAHEGPPSDGEAVVTFSPDGARTAYAVKKGEKWFAIVDGLQESPFDKKVFPEFSPDSKHVLYVAERGENANEFIVQDGKETPAYGSVDRLVGFSPDGKHVAYTAKRGGKHYVVLDGKPQEVQGSPANPRYSPNGQRLAFWLAEEGEWCVVVDGTPGKKYPGMTAEQPFVRFSPDSRHLTFAVFGRGSEAFGSRGTFVVVDGQQSPKYDEVGTGPVFRADGTLEFIASRGDDQYRVTAVLTSNK
jgi:hypothetical protein